VNIRESVPSDLPAALALNNANVPELNELDATELGRLVRESVLSLTAEVDGAFAGFCILFAPDAPYQSLNYQWFSRTYDDFVYLDRIAVHPDFRRYGIGRAFYAAVVDRFTGRFPLLCCEVNVRPRNEPSLAFHHAVGFREVGQQDTDHGKRVSLLALPLDGQPKDA